MIYITQLIYVKQGKESVFQEFENQAIPLMGKYTGKIVQRLRPSSEDFIEGEELKPYEIHIVSFESEEKFQDFLKDDARSKLTHLKEESVDSILMFKGKRM